MLETKVKRLKKKTFLCIQYLDLSGLIRFNNVEDPI